MHCSDAELIDRLYGVAEPGHHLEECPGCRARLEAMNGLRRRSAEAPPVPAEFLTTQRRAIWNRIEKASWRPRLFSPYPALVAVMAVVVAIVVTVPRPGSVPAGAPLVAPADAQLFSDVAAQVDSAWPGSVVPVSGPLASRGASPSLADSSSADQRLLDEIASDVAGNEPRAEAPIRALYSEAR